MGIYKNNNGTLDSLVNAGGGWTLWHEEWVIDNMPLGDPYPIGSHPLQGHDIKIVVIPDIEVDDEDIAAICTEICISKESMDLIFAQIQANTHVVDDSDYAPMYALGVWQRQSSVPVSPNCIGLNRRHSNRVQVQAQLSQTSYVSRYHVYIYYR